MIRISSQIDSISVLFSFNLNLNYKAIKLKLKVLSKTLSEKKLIQKYHLLINLRIFDILNFY